jgi:hypothetical protein
MVGNSIRVIIILRLTKLDASPTTIDSSGKTDLHYAMTSDGKEVSASDASRWRNYYCPACGGRVSLVRPYDKVDHFRHHPSDVAYDCPLYNPNGSWDGVYIGERYNRSIPPWLQSEVARSKVQAKAVTFTSKFGVRPFVWNPTSSNSAQQSADSTAESNGSLEAGTAESSVSGEKSQKPDSAAKRPASSFAQATCGLMALIIIGVAFFTATRFLNARCALIAGLVFLVFFVLPKLRE